jgi:hypothetical protein
MVPRFSEHASCAADRELQHLRAVLASSGMFAAHRLAAEERHRQWLIEAEQNRLLREAGQRPVRTATSLASLRRSLGDALIRVGRHLQSERDVAAVADHRV